MQKWVVIPKIKAGDEVNDETSDQSTGGGAEKALEQSAARGKGRRRKQSNPATDAVLREAGLKESKGEPKPTDEDSFQPLAQLGSYVLNTASQTIIDRVFDMLDATYSILPSIVLRAPRPSLGEIFSRRPRRTLQWPEISGIARAHKARITGKGVLVGVLDTGIDADHVEFRRKRIDYRYIPLDPGTDKLREVRGYDVDGHGTHVCGIIAGEKFGIAPDVDLMVASAIESETLKTTLDRVLAALDWMLQVIDRPENHNKPVIINMSLGFVPQQLSAEQVKSVGALLNDMVTRLVQVFDVLPVVSIGNDGPGFVRAPGYFREALSVGAVDFAGNPAPFSGGGRSQVTGEIEPDIAGYGVDILSSLERTIDGHSLYATMSGTSMAAPYVAGLAALYASQNPSLQGEALRRHLLATSLKSDWPQERVGAGLAHFE